jgi:hypothetical protein
MVGCFLRFLSVSNLPGIPGKLAIFRTGVKKAPTSNIIQKQVQFNFDFMTQVKKSSYEFHWAFFAHSFASK